MNRLSSALSPSALAHGPLQPQVRETVVQQLQLQPERYSMYVPGEYQQYCAEMAKSSTWGDHVTLQAAAGVQLVGRQTTQGFLDDKSNLALLVGTVRMITIMCVLPSEEWRTGTHVLTWCRVHTRVQMSLAFASTS